MVLSVTLELDLPDITMHNNHPIDIVTCFQVKPFPIVYVHQNQYCSGHHFHVTPSYFGVNRTKA